MRKYLALLVFTFACGKSPTEVKPVPNDTGQYNLTMVNGTQIPFQINKNNVIVGGLVNLKVDKTYLQAVSYQDSLGVMTVKNTSGTYSIVNTELFLSNTTGRSAVGDGILISTNTRQFKFVR